MKGRRVIGIIVSVFIGMLILLGILSSFVSDMWWFDHLGYIEVFWKSYSAQYTLWFVGFVTFLLVMNLNLSIALRSQSTLTVDPRLQGFVEGFRKAIRALAYGASLFLSFIMAGVLSDSWMEMLVFGNSEGFGLTDPIFGNEVSFYLFQLPFINTVKSWLIAATVLVLIGTVLVYVVRQGVSLTVGRVAISAQARKHLAVLAGVLLVLVAVDFWLGRYDILFSSRSSGFYGAGYTDVNAQLPASWIMSVLSLLSAGAVVFTIFARNFRLLAKVAIVYVAAIILVGSMYPALMQKFVVNPNEQSKELPFISNNIEFTRYAYELNRIEEKSIDPAYTLESQDILADSATVRNIMLWDYRPLASTLDQLQVIRLYYTFPDVDIDRYRLPDGSYRQVMLSARELDQSKLPANAQTWVNTNLVYTHGYGLGMSPVNVVTDEGLPEFFIKDIPPITEHGLAVTRPEIYYGEKTDNPVFILGDIEEFDYPLGDSNQMTKYQEDGGVPVNSFFRRLVLAMHFSDLNTLISGYIGPNSRVLYHRNIHERVRRLAPFLTYDNDPYLVVAGGRLHWIYDAYTTSKEFPYSRPMGDFNYIRNSVKIVIDAYTGETTFYKFNADRDPLIRIYENIFPDLFKDQSELPENLRAHIRYPQDQFDIQSEIYSTYHMEDPQVFYNKEDLWNIANEKLEEQVVKMESYYAIMRLPGEEREEFIQMVPYTPNRRDNMIAWLCARSDGENYGRMLVYKFPKKEQVFGPMQVAARIDQDPVISQNLALWNQQGSRVYRGNLLVIPIKEEVIYVQPVYLQATSGKLPELKRVIVAFHNRLAMEPTLEESLRRVFRINTPTADEPGTPTTSTVTSKMASRNDRSVRELSRAAMSVYENAMRAQREGDWARYGEEIETLKKELEELVKISEK
ncbi:MAG: UPF0182 family protein [Bacteroidota bacterium]|jgi:uncharacterized membrane protein (UPF0182 family)|nr:UPF0182 family protein [Bacteroidota bacterium]